MSKIDLGIILPLGTKTIFGAVSAITFIDGERYYFLVKPDTTVTMLPQAYFDHPTNMGIPDLSDAKSHLL
jgi:hypothetical protein